MNSNIKNIKAEFLNFSRRGDGHRYNNSELMRCRAFISFVHAEVEHYLEVSASRALDRAESRWNTKGSISKIIASLLAYRVDNVKQQNKSKHNERLLVNAVKCVFERQRKVIGSNNGVKEYNVLEMFSPLGIERKDIEEKLLINLDNFGSLRGDLVHRDTQVSLPKIPDPFDDVDRMVQDLVIDLKNFDYTITKLL